MSNRTRHRFTPIIQDNPNTYRGNRLPKYIYTIQEHVKNTTNTNTSNPIFKRKKEMQQPPKTVLITGVSGYIGSWCAHSALEAGYKVIGTVRNPQASKCTFLRNAMNGIGDKFSPKAKDNLTLVSADLLAGDEFWDTEIFAGSNIDFVFHTASPYFGKEPDDPQTYIRPAVEGTRSVLLSCVKHNVKHVVVTSSVAAVAYPQQDGRTYTPDDWSDVESDALSSYARSKTLAEKEAWKVVEGTETKLSTICPMFVIGPTLYGVEDDACDKFESGTLCQKIMMAKFPMVPQTKMGISDVRDVANAHVLCLQKTETAAGHRFLLSPECIWFEAIVQVFSGVKPELKIPVKVAPSWLIRVMAWWNPDMRRVTKSLDLDYTVDGSSYLDILGGTWTPYATSANDMMNDLIALGAAPEAPTSDESSSYCVVQ